MINVVLDASALLAFVQDEPGADVVSNLLDQAIISTVNWCEVIQKCVAKGIDITGLSNDLAELGVSIEPYTIRQAEIAGNLWLITRVSAYPWGIVPALH